VGRYLTIVNVLLVLTLSDSLAAAWPTVASAAGASLQVVTDPAQLPNRGLALLVNGAGAENRLEPVLASLAPLALPTAAVGTLADHRLAAAVVRAGAQEYFALPADLLLIEAWVRDQATLASQRAMGVALAATHAQSASFGGIVGKSPALRAALARAEKVMRHGHATVLLTGETGTGKELLARAVHFGGPRRDQPFVDVNCAAIPESLLESELFGHEKGAFTSATSAKPGLFEVADGGSIFLDEIGHLALPLQAKLLRAIQEREIRRVGGTRSVPVNVRVIAATHVNLATAVARGEFREDLYYRLNVVPIELPPLRDRADDAITLAERFLVQFAEEYSVRDARLSAEAKRRILAHAWPGNVRELRNAVERALLLADDPLIGPDDLLPAAESSSSAATRADGASARLPFPASMDEIEAAAAQAMLAACGGNKSAAARRLRISRMRLSRLLEGADISYPDDPHDAEHT
jgi:transcriptional regulator with GAF, ATPase, and Fis domain